MRMSRKVTFRFIFLLWAIQRFPRIIKHSIWGFSWVKVKIKGYKGEWWGSALLKGGCDKGITMDNCICYIWDLFWGKAIFWELLLRPLIGRSESRRIGNRTPQNMFLFWLLNSFSPRSVSLEKHLLINIPRLWTHNKCNKTVEWYCAT